MLILFVGLFAASLLLNVFLWYRRAGKRSGTRVSDTLRSEQIFPEGAIQLSAETQLNSLLERIIRNNRLLLSLQERLDQVVLSGSTVPLAKMRQMLDMGLRAEEDWALFLELFSAADPEYWRALHRAYPQLNAADLRLIALIRLDWKQSEMPILLNIGEEGVRKAVYRLRKKNADASRGAGKTIPFGGAFPGQVSLPGKAKDSFFI